MVGSIAASIGRTRFIAAGVGRTRSIAASIGRSAGDAIWTTAKFTAQNPIASKIAAVGCAYLIGPCSLIVTTGYLAMKMSGNPDVFAKVGIKDPRMKMLAKAGVAALTLGAYCEFISASMATIKLLVIAGYVFYAAPDIKEIVFG